MTLKNEEKNNNTHTHNTYWCRSTICAYRYCSAKHKAMYTIRNDSLKVDFLSLFLRQHQHLTRICASFRVSNEEGRGEEEPQCTQNPNSVFIQQTPAEHQRKALHFLLSSDHGNPDGMVMINKVFRTINADLDSLSLNWHRCVFVCV